MRKARHHYKGSEHGLRPLEIVTLGNRHQIYHPWTIAAKSVACNASSRLEDLTAERLWPAALAFRLAK